MTQLVHAPDALSTSVQPWPEDRRLGPRRQELVFGHVVSSVDALVLVASFCIAYGLRERLEWYGHLQPMREYVWVAAIVVPIWIALARAMALNVSQTYRWPARPVTLTLKVHAAASLVLLSLLYLLKAEEVSRLFIQTFLIVSAIALVAERLAIHAVIVKYSKQWKPATRRLLVVGPAAVAEGLDRLLRQRPHWGASVAGVITDDPIDPVFGEVPVLGRISELGILDTMVFDEVVMANAGIEHEHGDRIMAVCLERGLTYHTLVKMQGPDIGRHHAEVLGEGLYLISLEATPQEPIALFVKRTIDIVGASMGLTLCALAFVVFAPLIRLSSRGPVIFRQVRIGRNGRRFTIYKFRTMLLDAESQKEGLLAVNEMSGHLFKLRNDPRVTPIGRFLRRTYLDELPQFWNVLKGEMSLVGTRPPTPDEVARYSAHHRRRLSVRPGITGLWQCHGNGRVSDFDTVVRLDCEYIDRWSILLDLKILGRTCFSVARLAGH